MDKLAELKQRMAELRRQRDMLSVQIRDLWYEIYYLEAKRPIHKERKAETSLAYQMFGKQYKDMTPEELKIYNKASQQRYRAKWKDKGDDNNG